MPRGSNGDTFPPAHNSSLGMKLLCAEASAPVAAAKRLLAKKGTHSTTVRYFWNELHINGSAVYVKGKKCVLHRKMEMERFEELFWLYATCNDGTMRRHLGLHE